MKKFQIHTIETAPAESKKSLEQSLKYFGMIPNLHGILAESPELLKAYKALNDLFEHSSFNADELTVVWQSINVEHECHYCVPAHTGVSKMMNVDDEITEALRNETVLPSEKLEVLRETTLSIVRNRGRLTEEEAKRFYAVGYENRHMLDIILGLSQKVISNYVNHIAETPIDKPFEKYKWEKRSKK